MGKSEKQQHVEQMDRLANIVASVLSGSDADLSNWTDEAVRIDAHQAVYGLAKLAAASVERQAASTGAAPVEELVASFVAAFGHDPTIR